MRPSCPTSLLAALAAALLVGAGDGDPKAGDPAQGAARVAPIAPIAPARKSASTTPAPITPEREAEALDFVGRNHPELATVLEVLKPMDPAEYRKAIGELSAVARTLADLRARNPRRYELALDAWKAKSRVELLAAQLAGSPGEGRQGQLRSAIEARLDVEIRRQKFELEQAEAAARKAREAIDRLESRRGEIVESRLRSLQPRKARRAEPARSAAEKSEPSTTPKVESRR